MFGSSKSLFRPSIATICALAVLDILGCGGGGGGGGNAGGGGEVPLVYAGNSNAATITAGNAAKLTFDVIDSGGSGATAIITGPLNARSGASQRRPSGLAALTRRVNRNFFETLVHPGHAGLTRKRELAIAVDDTTLCDSGSVRTSGTLSDAGTGTLALSFDACRVGIDTLSGSATLRIDGFDLSLLTATDATVSFARLTFRSSADNVVLSGSVRSQLDAGTSTSTLNVVFLDNTTGEMGRAESFVVIDALDAVLPSLINETLSGRIFDSVHGFVDVATLEPLRFNSPSQAFPNPGQLKLVGASGRSIQVTAISDDNVGLELDLDADTNFESWTTVPWTGLSRTAVLDFTRPMAPVVSINVNNDRSVTITWTASSDSAGIREYRVQRGTMPVGRTTGTVFIDRSAEPGSSVDYYVRAVDNSGNLSDLIAPMSAKIPSSGTGSFAAPISGTLPFAVDISGVGIGVADVNGDGSRDLMVSGGIATALGPLTTGVAFTVSPIDFATMTNDRNQPFFLLANITGSDLPEALGAGRTLRWNTTNNSWEDSVGSNQSFQFEARTYIDLNDDGILDIISSANFSSRLSGTLGTGNGSYDASSARPLAGIKNFVWGRIGAIVAADVDRDGLTDLIVWDTDLIRVVRQTKRGSFAVVASLLAIDNAGFRAALLVADVTGDGYPEIIYAHYADSVDQLRVYLNDGAGNFGSTAIASNVASPWNFAAADIDGDGIPDLIVGNRITMALDFYVARGDGKFTFSSATSGVGFPFISLADIDLDGDIDIVTGGSVFQSTDVKIYLNQ